MIPALVMTVLSSPTLEARDVERFVSLALECVHKEYPNKISHVLTGDRDIAAPRDLTPVFFGCYDWHSSVHGHWLLVRALRSFPSSGFAPKVRSALARSFTSERVRSEVAYLHGRGRGPFERPYGLAWLLQLSAELHAWDDAQGQQWADVLLPLEAEAAVRFAEWLPKLSFPIRTGEHSQTAFAMGLVLDWARTRGEVQIEKLVVARARDYYEADNDYPLRFEPGGQDFLSPAWAEADLMRRVLPASEFSIWLSGFLPILERLSADASTEELGLTPAIVTDKSDGKLAHLDGLNLSRAWMIEGVLEALPQSDSRRAPLRQIAQSHRTAGLNAVTGEHYEGGHWLGSFAMYLVTRAGKSGAEALK